MSRTMNEFYPSTDWSSSVVTTTIATIILRFPLILFSTCLSLCLSLSVSLRVCVCVCVRVCVCTCVYVRMCARVCVRAHVCGWVFWVWAVHMSLCVYDFSGQVVKQVDGYRFETKVSITASVLDKLTNISESPLGPRVTFSWRTEVTARSQWQRALHPSSVETSGNLRVYTVYKCHWCEHVDLQWRILRSFSERFPLAFTSLTSHPTTNISINCQQSTVLYVS